jgi:Circularly permutated YpsA SLOG family
MRGSLPDGPTLNVAGPRESEAAGIYIQARDLLERCFG